MDWKKPGTREAVFNVTVSVTMVLAIVAPCYFDRLWAVVFFIPFTCVVFLGNRWFDLPGDGWM